MKTILKSILLFITSWVLIFIIYSLDLFDVLEIPFASHIGNRHLPFLSLIMAIGIISLLEGLMNKYLKLSLRNFLFIQLIFIISLVLFLYFITRNITYFL